MAGLARMRGWTRRLLHGDPALHLPAAPAAPAPPPPAPAPFRGEVQALSAVHAEGWAQHPQAQAARVAMEAVLPATGQVLARAIADRFTHGLAAAAGNDGAHGFLLRFDPPLDPQTQAALEIRPHGGPALPRAAHIVREFQPILHVAMDVVDNCNLRCPFCLFDYANTRATHFMDEATIDAALRLLPYVRDGEFWFSCLHEPTLHPRLTQYIDKVPRDLRRKLFYTTNLAKRMPPDYFAWFAGNGMHHVNISIESREPALYERMRKGARHRIFMENWDHLLRALDQGAAPPRLRYIAMVYRSNLAELPAMVDYLLQERRAAQVELRYTFDVPHLPDGFREAEFLHPDQWLWLRDQLAGYPADRLQLSLPPDPAPAGAAVPPAPDAGLAASAASGAVLPDKYLFRMSWDGSLRIFGVAADSRGDEGREVLMRETNVRQIGDPAAFLRELALPAA